MISRVFGTFLSLAAACFFLVGPATGQDLPWENVSVVDLGTDGFDFDIDLSRGLVYVSLPDANALAYISLEDGTVQSQHFVGARPLGVDYGQHSDRVYVALNQAAAVAQVNPDLQSVNEIVVGGNDGTGNNLTFDVVEASAGQVFASANPGSGGFARIARIDTNNNNSISRVAGNRIIRASPTFLQTPDEQVLFIGEGFSPNSLYGLDITDPTGPIFVEDDHGSVSGTTRTSISPDGSRIYLSSGQVLRSDSLVQSGSIGNGISEISSDGALAYVFRQGGFSTYSTETFLEVGSPIILPAEFGNQVSQFRLLPNGGGLIALHDNQLLIATNEIPEPTGIPFALGDVNRDGEVNFLDISPFIALLDTGEFQAEADFNMSGEITFLDVSPFIMALTGG